MEPEEEEEEEEESSAEHYRKRAAKTREIAKSVTIPGLSEHLETVAREYDEIADRLEAGAQKP